MFRRFLLEWLSFAYRYVPHGLLKFPPQRINERCGTIGIW
jgi:tRNA-dihydrouridine synthase 3